MDLRGPSPMVNFSEQDFRTNMSIQSFFHSKAFLKTEDEVAI